MRQLTDSELKTRDKAWLECLGNRRERSVDLDFFEAGFIAGLEHQRLASSPEHRLILSLSKGRRVPLGDAAAQTEDPTGRICLEGIASLEAPDNHTAVTHEFTRRCLRFFYEDIPEGEYDGSEDDLREYAATINEGFGYDLDKRIADLKADNAKLREACEAIQEAFAKGEIKFTKVRQSDSDPYHPANIKLAAALGEESDG